MDKKLFEIIACPVCKGELFYDKQAQELQCNVDKLAFPIHNDIPVLLEEDARKMG